ncbi:hypothetical protein KM043_013829 [Ampulex compressa]|nr:hypothetical protein KM043_013829 [Ampulex compressa]
MSSLLFLTCTAGRKLHNIGFTSHQDFIATPVNIKTLATGITTTICHAYPALKRRCNQPHTVSEPYRTRSVRRCPPTISLLEAVLTDTVAIAGSRNPCFSFILAATNLGLVTEVPIRSQAASEEKWNSAVHHVGENKRHRQHRNLRGHGDTLNSWIWSNEA